MIDASSRVVRTLDCSPTDELAHTMLSNGMSRRLGDESRPSHALLERHIRYLDTSLRARYQDCKSPQARLELCRAGLANGLAWTGWLRATELFGIRWCDIVFTPAELMATHDLPAVVAMLQLRLAPATKSCRTKVADVILAAITHSGFDVGFWYHSLRTELRLTSADAAECPALVFQHSNGTSWDSKFFRGTYLIPSLNDQRLAGDPSLLPFDGSTPGNTLAEKFWSMHSYRRGARSHVSRKRATNGRKASEDEVNEHGRWRVKRTSLSMSRSYLQWPISDRFQLTARCM